MKKPIILKKNNRLLLQVGKKEQTEEESFPNWTELEDLILLEAIETLKIRNKWNSAAKLLNRKSQDCIDRYKAIKPLFKRGHWTPEEDKQLIFFVEIHGKNWAQISHTMKQRTGKQIRQRFLNFLDPKIKKDKFTINEDIKIFKLYKIFKTNWRYYTTYIPNRTADRIKGRYYSFVRFKENLLKLIDGLDVDFCAEALKEQKIPEIIQEKKAEKFVNFNNNVREKCIVHGGFNEILNIIDNSDCKNNIKNKINKNEINNKKLEWDNFSNISKLLGIGENHMHPTNCSNSLEYFGFNNFSDFESLLKDNGPHNVNNTYNNYIKNSNNLENLDLKLKHSTYSSNHSLNSLSFSEVNGQKEEDETLTDYEEKYVPKLNFGFEDEHVFSSKANLIENPFMKF
jgi:myb proto-oncogene protein